jgi:2-(1,2-epoxy-1,2-dihydrophenyl)acetyl-CoA isomerase
MAKEMVTAARLLADDPEVRVLVLTGEGRGFCAGADVQFMNQSVQEGRYADAMGLLDSGNELVRLLRDTPKPVLGSLNGPTAGGGASLALACDLRIASEKASIGFVFHKLGLHPDMGAVHCLSRQIGSARALELFWSGEMVPAADCLRLGLVNRVVPDADLASATADWSRRLAALPALIAGISKAAVYASESRDFPSTLALERANQLVAFQSADAAEGLAAFVNKRSPRFAGS